MYNVFSISQATISSKPLVYIQIYVTACHAKLILSIKHNYHTWILFDFYNQRDGLLSVNSNCILELQGQWKKRVPFRNHPLLDLDYDVYVVKYTTKK